MTLAFCLTFFCLDQKKVTKKSQAKNMLQPLNSTHPRIFGRPAHIVITHVRGLSTKSANLKLCRWVAADWCDKHNFRLVFVVPFLGFRSLGKQRMERIKRSLLCKPDSVHSSFIMLFEKFLKQRLRSSCQT